MSKNKRPSIKGRGADIFLADDTLDASEQHAVLPAHQHPDTTAKQLNVEPVNHHDDITVLQHNGMTLCQHSATPAKQMTSPAAPNIVKSTFYLDYQIYADLDDLWLRLRRSDKTATKSGIVNEILAKGISDKIAEIELTNKIKDLP